MTKLRSLTGGRAWAARLLVLLPVLALVWLAVAVLPAFGTHGTDNQNPLTGLPDAGVLRVHFESGSNDFLRFDPHSGSSSTAYTNGTSYPINVVQKCVLALSSAAPLSFAREGTPASTTIVPGSIQDGIGIFSGSKGTDCGQVNLSPNTGVEDVLVIALSGELADKEIDYAELDVEGKFDATIEAQLFLGSTPVSGAVNGGATTSILTLVDCGPPVPSDCGPDSGDGDNFRVRIDGVSPWNKIKIWVSEETPSAAFSLEGGADGTSPGVLGTFLSNTTDSLFHITDVLTLQCGGDAGGSTGTGPTGSIELSGCTGSKSFVYASSPASGGDPQTVTLTPAGTLSGYFLETIVWDGIAVPTGTQSYGEFKYTDTPAGITDQLVPWCDVDPRTSGGTLPSSLTEAQINGVLPNGSFSPGARFYNSGSPGYLAGQHTWCLLEAHFEEMVVNSATGETKLFASHTTFGVGDPGKTFR